MKYDPIMCMMVDDSVKTKDLTFVQLKFGSGRTEGAKLEENEYREYAEALLKKYGEKRVTLSKQGKVIVTYTNPNDSKTIDHAIRICDSRVSTRNVVTSNIAFEEIKKMTGIIPEKVQQKGDTMEFYHSGVKVAEWDMNNAEVKVFV